MKPIKRQFGQERDVNVTATMININSDSGDEILSKCKALMEYVAFIAKVREKLDSGMIRDEAIPAAVDECIEENILREILLKHKGEVTDMILTEFNQERYAKGLLEEGELYTILRLYQKGRITTDEAAEELGVTEDSLRELLLKNQYMVTSLAEFNQGRHEKGLREEGRIEELLSLVQDGILTAEQAAPRIGKTEEEFRAMLHGGDDEEQDIEV